VNNFIIDPLFERRTVHIVAGASGAGKTIWLLETMTKWARGEDVMGFKSYPEPWLYVSGDRSGEAVWRKIDCMGLNRSEIPLLPAYATGHNTLDWEKIFVQILDSGAKTIVWEGFGRYIPSNAKGNAVDIWIEQIIYQAEKNDLTIIGVCEQPKMKPRDKYSNPRQRISGPAAWGHHTSTTILIEPADEKTPSNPNRVLYCIIHDGGAPKELRATMKDNHLVFLP
jgi:hypothetical protein